MLGCESILAVTGSWLISVCGFCLYGIRSWKSHARSFLGMKELLGLLQRCWIGEASPIRWPWRSCEFYPCRQCFLICHRTHLYSTIWHSPDGKTHWNWTCFETWSFLGLYVRGWVNYLQSCCICVPVGSTVVFACIAKSGFLLITAAQVWSC